MKRTWQVAAVLGVYMACFVFFQTKWAALVLGGILPAVAAAGAIVLSVRSAIRNFGAVQLVLGVPIVVASVFSLLILKRIVIDGAWPTYLPHLAIGASCLLAGLQLWLGRRTSGREDAQGRVTQPPNLPR